MKVYIAGPLFTTAEQVFNLQIKENLIALNPALDVLLPQIQGQQVAGQENFEQLIFDHCKNGVFETDVVVAFLEGPDVDSGTCIELGFAHIKERKIIGVRTDFRGSEAEGLNIMVRKVLDRYLYYPQSYPDVEELARDINQAINSLSPSLATP